MSVRSIKVAYADLQNAGDLFNKECIERYSCCKVIRSRIYDADMIAIGGALVGAQYSNVAKYRVIQKFLHVIYGNKPLYVWGSGFFRNDNEHALFRKNLQICALRGNLTRTKLERLTGQKYDVPLADTGLLVSEFVSKSISKKYQVGIIPHFWQIGESRFNKLATSLKNSHIIDIQKSPVEVATEIAQCEFIMSSSLHGLIFADSLHVPSLHLLGGKALDGGMFKFKDYYTSFGLEDNAWDISNKLPVINDIIDYAKINFNEVDCKKEQLINCCPRFL